MPSPRNPVPSPSRLSVTAEEYLVQKVRTIAEPVFAAVIAEVVEEIRRRPRRESAPPTPSAAPRRHTPRLAGEKKPPAPAKAPIQTELPFLEPAPVREAPPEVAPLAPEPELAREVVIDYPDALLGGPEADPPGPWAPFRWFDPTGF